MSKPITLVLGGTGIKGAASIGVLQALHNNGVKIKKIIAAGISAPISAQYALGEDPDQLTEEFTRFFVENNHELWGLEQLTGILMSRRRRRLDNFAYFLRERLYCHANFSSKGVLSWDTVEPQITRLFGDKSFSDLKVPLAVSAIDLKHGKLVLIEKGKLKDSLKASMAFPGILPPVVSGKMELVSSTVYSELPLDGITKKDTPVIAIDLPDTTRGRSPQTLLEVISIVDDIRSQYIKKRLITKADYIFQLQGMKKFRWGDYRQIPQIVAQAAKETDRLLKRIELP
jgi:NTE family protein